MVEKSPADWQDENLGEKFSHFLRQMRTHLMKERLPNYFMYKHNMFRSVPRHKLRKAQEKFHRLHENLVPHLLLAMKHLQYEKNFYPMPDLDQLYQILSTKTTIQMQINPALLGGNAFTR